jgi:hypothetical protein
LGSADDGVAELTALLLARSHVAGGVTAPPSPAGLLSRRRASTPPRSPSRSPRPAFSAQRSQSASSTPSSLGLGLSRLSSYPSPNEEQEVDTQPRQQGGGGEGGGRAVGSQGRASESLLSGAGHSAMAALQVLEGMEHYDALMMRRARRLLATAPQ